MRFLSWPDAVYDVSGVVVVPGLSTCGHLFGYAQKRSVQRTARRVWRLSRFGAVS